MSQEKTVRVGVAVIVRHPNWRDQYRKNNPQVILMERIGSHGSGTLSFPGGHLEYKESVSDCAKREVKEETGLDVKLVKNLGYTEDIFSIKGKHYITLFYLADLINPNQQPQICEPDKCYKIEWVNWFDLLKDKGGYEFKLFLPVRNFLSQKWREVIRIWDDM